MTLYWKIPLSVTLIAPWVIPGDEPAGSDTDVRLARGEGGAFALPGTHIKGHLRAAMERLQAEGSVTAADLSDLFGAESGRAGADWQGANRPERGRLIFGDLRMTAAGGEPSGDGFSVRVEIDDDLHAAREGHLLFVECPYPFGTEVTFSGEIIARGSADPKDAVARLEKAAKRVFAIGGMKSVGYGRVKPGSWTFGRPQAVAPATVSGATGRETVTYEITRPFLVNTRRFGGNLMVGSDVIPGGAIKGALAEAWGAAGHGGAALSALRIGHAYPEKANGSPAPWRPVPLSLSIAGEKLYCHLQGDVAPADTPHVFAQDWKAAKTSQARASLGLPDPRPELSGRSRTAIDRDTLGARYSETIEDAPTGETGGQLFSSVSVKPDDHVWIGTISGDADAVEKALAILQAGLPGLGKTGAVIKAVAHDPAGGPEPPGGALNLCLISEAAILDPAEARNGATLHEAYACYFKANGFTLERFFSRESLRGGYLALRYPPEGGGYSPWLITEPGSVFRVSPAAGTDVAGILANGLPPAGCYSPDWQKMPFLRENGYGAVAMDVVDHAALQKGENLKRGGA